MELLLWISTTQIHLVIAFPARIIGIQIWLHCQCSVAHKILAPRSGFVSYFMGPPFCFLSYIHHASKLLKTRHAYALCVEWIWACALWGWFSTNLTVLTLSTPSFRLWLYKTQYLHIFPTGHGKYMVILYCYKTAPCSHQWKMKPGWLTYIKNTLPVKINDLVNTTNAFSVRKSIDSPRPPPPPPFSPVQKAGVRVECDQKSWRRVS